MPQKAQRDKKHAQYINPQILRITFTDIHFYAFTSLQNKAKGKAHHPTLLYKHWSATI